MKTKEFIKKLNGENKELIIRMEGAQDIDEAYLIARNAGLTDSKDVFFLQMLHFKKAVEQISVDDLEKIACNASTSQIVSAVSVYTGAAAAAGSAAAV